MLTSEDKKYILNTIKTNIQILLKEIVELFDATNKRIDESNERIDKVLAQLKDHNDILDNHERRIEKVEEKVFTTTIA